MANGNSGRQSLSLIVAHVSVALAVIICSTVLVGFGKLTVEAYVTLLGAAIGLTGGAAGAIVTSATAAKFFPPGSTVTTPPGEGKSVTTTVEQKGP